MTKLERISREIEALAPDDFSKFREWFAEFEADRWDTQIEADAKAGKLDKFAEQALADLDAGLTRPL